MHSLGLELADLDAKFNALWDSFPTVVQDDRGPTKDIPANRLEELNKMMDDRAELSKRFEQARQAEEFAAKLAAEADAKRGIAPHPQPPAVSASPAPAQVKTLSQTVFDSKVVADGLKADPGFLKKVGDLEFPDFDFKTLMETGAGWAPESTRSGRVVMLNQRQPHVIDAIPQVPINQAASVYMRESTFTNNAVEKAEGAEFGEAALALTEITQPVQKFPVWIPVTDEQLEYEPGVRAYIDNRLMLMLAQRVDTQIINGDGTPPNIAGFLNISGISTIATGTDSRFAVLLKARTRVRVGGSGGDDLGWAEPTALFIHPLDWQNLVLETTTDGQFILGNPNESMSRMMIWGLPVVETTCLAQGTALTGDFRMFSAWRNYKGLRINMYDQHADFAIKGKKAITAQIWGALDVYRNVAFCSITGLPA